MEDIGRKSVIQMEQSLGSGRNKSTTGEIMVKKLTIDGSVIISSLLKSEPRHKEGYIQH